MCEEAREVSDEKICRGCDGQREAELLLLADIRKAPKCGSDYRQDTIYERRKQDE